MPFAKPDRHHEGKKNFGGKFENEQRTDARKVDRGTVSVKLVFENKEELQVNKVSSEFGEKVSLISHSENIRRRINSIVGFRWESKFLSPSERYKRTKEISVKFRRIFH